MFCPNCGNELPEGAKFCTNCGNRIEASSTSIPSASMGKQNPVKQKKKSILKRWWFWVIVVFVLAAIGSQGRNNAVEIKSTEKQSNTASVDITKGSPKSEETTKTAVTSAPTPKPTPEPTPMPTPTPAPTPKPVKKYTLNDGKYIVGQDIEPGTYTITCIKSEGETYGNAYSALGGIYDSLDGSDNLGGMMDALGGLMTEVITTSVEILGDYGTVLRSFEMKKGDSMTVTLNEKTAIEITFGTCTLESN